MIGGATSKPINGYTIKYSVFGGIYTIFDTVGNKVFETYSLIEAIKFCGEH